MKKNHLTFQRIFKKEIKLATYIITCMTIVVISISYAMFFQVDDNSSNQKIVAGNLEFTYTEGLTITTSENSQCFMPMTAEIAALYASECSYQFSVQNTGSLKALYTLSLVETNTNTMDNSKLKIILKRQNGDLLELVEGFPKTISELSMIANEAVLLQYDLDSYETDVYSIQIYIDESLYEDTDANQMISYQIKGSGIVHESEGITSDITITSFDEFSLTEGVESLSESYAYNSLNFSVSLPEATSTAMYKVNVTNYGSSEMGIFDITGLPENLDYDITGYTLKDKICDDAGNCTDGAVEEFYITLKYAESGYDNNNVDYDIELILDYRNAYNITYENITNNNYPTHILAGNDLMIQFIDNIPEDLFITGSSLYTYESPNLTIPNVTSDIVISNAVVYQYDGEYVCDGTNYIDTGVNLFNEENINRNFEVTFEVKSYGDTQMQYGTLFNSMDESVVNFPGIVFRLNINANGYEFVGNNLINGFEQAKEKFAYDDVQKVKILRINNTIYYSINDGDFYESQKYTVFGEYFEIPVTFGASLDESQEPYRYFVGTMANMKIKFLQDDVSVESFDVMYKNVESLVFDGTNYLDTGVYLFNEENAHKDFIMNFTVSESSETQETYATIMNSLSESMTGYPGIIFRFYNTSTTQYQLTANGSTRVYELFEVTDVSNVVIKRINQKLSYSINNTDFIELQDFSDFTTYFDVPVTFGASLDGDGAPYRYFIGTLDSVEIRLKNIN